MQRDPLLLASIALAFLASAFVLAGIRHDATLEQAPLVTVGEARLNFGTVPEGETVTHTFKLCNLSHVPLYITSQSDCSCTTMTADKSPVLPDAVHEITVSFDTAGYQHYASKGVTVNASPVPPAILPPSANPLRVELSGNIQPICTVTPQMLQFSPGEDAVKTVTIEAGHAHPIKILEAHTTEPAFKAHVVRGIADTSPATIEVQFQSSKWNLKMAGHGELIITTDVLTRHRSSIPLLVLPTTHPSP